MEPQNTADLRLRERTSTDESCAYLGPAIMCGHGRLLQRCPNASSTRREPRPRPGTGPGCHPRAAGRGGFLQPVGATLRVSRTHTIRPKARQCPARLRVYDASYQAYALCHCAACVQGDSRELRQGTCQGAGDGALRASGLGRSDSTTGPSLSTGSGRDSLLQPRASSGGKAVHAKSSSTPCAGPGKRSRWRGSR